MRFLFALLSVASLAAAAVPIDFDYDFDTFASGDLFPRTTGTTTTTGQKEYPFGQEMAMGIKELSKFDQAKITADRIGHYEINPNFDFNGVRSLDLKMTPILNFQKSNFASVPSSSTGMSKGRKMMMKLLNLGIKPHTVKKFLFLKKQGIIGMPVEDPVAFMLQMQKEDDVTGFDQTRILPSSSEQLRSSWLGDMPITSDVQHGVVIPSLSFANSLREQGVIVSTSVTGQPAIEIKHLQDSLIQCESLEWKSGACVRLHQLAINLLGNENTSIGNLHASIMGLTTDPQILRNVHTDIMQ